MKPLHTPESGVALITSLVLLAILTLLGAAAVLTGILDTKIGGNYKASVQAFYAAEAGLAEARGRLRSHTGGNRIAYTTTSPQWKAYIASGTKTPAAALQRVQTLGYDTIHHSRYASVQSALDYTVVIEPVAVGVSQLRITSYGSASTAEKSLQIVVTAPASLTIPAALYVETPTLVEGGITTVTGLDRCGSDDKPGVLTPLPLTAIAPVHGPYITGTPALADHGTTLDIPAIVDTLKPYANFTYTVNNATYTATTTPGPGDAWGRPSLGTTPQDASTCSVYNVVHYHTAGTSITLHNGVSGCGILLVEGNLELQQGFSWYGLVLVTGTVTFATAGQQQHITGAVLSGGSSGQNSIGVDAHIVYCSAAVNTQNLPLRVLSWKELYTTLPSWKIFGLARAKRMWAQPPHDGTTAADDKHFRRAYNARREYRASTL